MTGHTLQSWALCLFLLSLLAHVETGLSTSDADTYEELLKAIKTGSFTLQGKNNDDSRAVLQQILDKSKYSSLQVLF